MSSHLAEEGDFTCSSSALLCCGSQESSQSMHHILLFSMQQFQLSHGSEACHPMSIPTRAGFPCTHGSRTWAVPQAPQLRHSDSKEAAMGVSWSCSRGLGRGRVEGCERPRCCHSYQIVTYLCQHESIAGVPGPESPWRAVPKSKALLPVRMSEFRRGSVTVLYYKHAHNYFG